MENNASKKYIWYWIVASGAAALLGLVGLSLWLENTAEEPVEKPLYTERLKNERDQVESVIKIDDSLITASTDGRLIYSNTQSDDTRVINSSDPVMRMALLKDRLVMATRDRGDIIIYSRDLKTSQKIFTFPEGSVNCLTVSKQGKILAGDFMGRLMIYDDSTKQLLNSWDTDSYHGVCGFVGEDIVVLNRDNQVLFSKFPYTSMNKAADLSDSESLESGRISPSGRFMVARNSTVNGSMDSFIIYDLKSFKAITEVPAEPEELEWGFSPNGEHFLTGNGSNWKVIDIPGGNYKSLHFGMSFSAGVFADDTVITLVSTSGELKEVEINQY